MIVSRKSFLISSFGAVFAFVPCAVCTAEPVTLSGRVIDQATERPLGGIRVGAVRWAQLGERDDEDQVEPELKAVTNDKGRYQFSVPEDTPGLGQVVVFTCSEDHRNLIHQDVRFADRLPRVSDLRRPGVVPIDGARNVSGIDFALSTGTSFLRNIRVPMRDGTGLATDIYFPPGRGPWPVVLYRTPYNKIGEDPAAHLERGYAVVKQDFRGRFASQGDKDMPFEPDGWGECRDGYDTIEWIAAQPWCNGKIATVGASAMGITQVMTAGATPPHLTCQFIAVAFGSMYHHAAYPGGAFRKQLVEGWLEGNSFSPECLATCVAHPSYDDFWRRVDASGRSAQVKVPGFFLGGWYDVFNQGTIDAFLWRQHEGGPGARGRQKLLMGPWVHGMKKEPGEFTLPDHARHPPPAGQQGPWLEYWLTGKGSDPADSAPVVYYVMGAFDEPGAPGHEWRLSDVWPVPCTPTLFYLHDDGTLSTDKPAANGEPRTYNYDPKNPVPTLGGCNLLKTQGPYDQRPVEDRPDVLLYTSKPLTEPLEVTGRIKAYLWASSSCRDTDFTVKLTDVYPDGKSVLVQDGIIRARHRDSFEREELMKPGDVYRFEVDLWSTSLIFNKGHRIRVAVSSSNAPRFEPNPNTGDAFRANDKTVVAGNTIHHDAGRPSHILLPVALAKPAQQEAREDKPPASE